MGFAAASYPFEVRNLSCALDMGVERLADEQGT